MPHIHEKIDFTAEVFIVHGGEVLLRKHDKLKIWMSVGGHIELHEDPPTAALREVREEVGLEVVLLGDAKTYSDGTIELITPRFLNRHKVNDTHEHIASVYFATAPHRNVVEGVPSEKSDGIKWFTREELDDPTYGVIENVRYYAKAALDAAK